MGRNLLLELRFFAWNPRSRAVRWFPMTRHAPTPLVVVASHFDPTPASPARRDPLSWLFAVLLAVFGLCLLTPAPVRAQSVEWTPLGLSLREGHAMAYDAARGETVLFGGITAGSFSDDTWEWNGTVWTQRTASGPSPRSRHAMAYDAGHGVTVLFGGYTADAGWN